MSAECSVCSTDLVGYMDTAYCPVCELDKARLEILQLKATAADLERQVGALNEARALAEALVLSHEGHIAGLEEEKARLVARTYEQARLYWREHHAYEASEARLAQAEARVAAMRNAITLGLHAPSGAAICACHNRNAVSAGLEKPCWYCLLRNSMEPDAGRAPQDTMTPPRSHPMRLRVQHEDGSIETLTLREPLVLVEGQHQNRITDGSHMDYWFTQDGHYDGWGRALPGLPDDETDILVEEIQRTRVIEETP